MQRHLVIQLARFGDLVQTKRLVLSLAAAGEVHLLVDASLAELARLLYPQARVWAIHAHAGGALPAAVLAAARQALSALAGLDFSSVCNLNHSGLNLALARAFAPEIVRGHACAAGQALRDQWTEFAFRWTGRRELAGLNLVDFWAHLAPEPVAPWSVNPPAVAKGGGLGVVLAGRHARRSLPVGVLLPLIQAVWSRLGSGRKPILLLGGPGERSAGRELAARLPRRLAPQVRNLAGATDWAGLIETVSGLDAVLTPDTGTMHLAAHLGTPVVATFLSSAWCFETGPYGEGHTVFQAVAPCVPCREAEACPHTVACRAPFASRELLACASGREPPAPPSGLALFTPVFDDLGLDFAARLGQDPWRESRRHFRAFLSGHLRLPGAETAVEPELAGRLYGERDWMARPRGRELQGEL